MKSRFKRESINLDLTPLIDCIFLLLIFFLVTSSFNANFKNFKIALPSSFSGDALKQEEDSLSLVISEKGFSINGETVMEESIENKLKNTKKDSQINLFAEPNVPYKKFIKVMDLLKKNKMTKLSLITKNSHTNNNDITKE